MKNASYIVGELINLQRKYATTCRAITTEERYNRLIESGVLKDYTFDSEAIREPLIEHVGHLSIIASYLHQHLEHKSEVDLGRTLIMLSVHDIGETVLGDIITYKKTKDREELERRQVEKILSEDMLPYFQEFEERQTLSAKFAKAVDSLAPMLHEIALPKVTIERFKHFGFNSEAIRQKYSSRFSWDKTLQEIFDYLMDEYKKIENSYSPDLTVLNT